MDLKSGYPYWVVKNEQGEFHPPLADDLRCDVLVVGAGITGALIADCLSAAGHQVCLVDSRQIGWGSTSASTALLQYEIDVEMQQLAKRFGMEDAVLAYRACEQAVRELKRLAKPLRSVDFRPTQSLYVSSHWYHDRRVRSEGQLRRRHGFDVEVLDGPALNERFGIGTNIGLLTTTSAECDPLQLARALLARVLRRGGQVFERSCVEHVTHSARGVTATLKNGAKVRCKHLVLAAGYESQRFLEQRVARNHSSYALVTDPMPDSIGALSRCLFWESARPYMYVRSTVDQRLIIGGEDDLVDLPMKRDASVTAKSHKLLKKVAKWFPRLTPNIAYAWGGTFAETEDGLPFFGPHEQHGPHIHFAMAYGGNGITYSTIGAQIIKASLEKRRHPCAELFSFARLKRK